MPDRTPQRGQERLDDDQQPTHELAPGGGPTTVEAQQLVADTQTTMREMAQATALRDLSATRDTPAPVQAPKADISDELEQGGPAFGSFLSSVGLAVADSQSALDKDLVQTAKALSDTKINVIAVFEQQINDDTGEMSQGIPHMQELPLINYLMPTAYQYSRVYLQAEMNVSQFNSANGFNIQRSATNGSANMQGNFGLLGGGISGGSNFNYSNSNQTTANSTSLASAAGSLHMEATLEPRADIQLPQPFITQKGPRLQVLIGARQDITDSNQAVIGRQVTLTAVLTKSNGAANTGKVIEVSVDRADLAYSGNGTTDNDGKVAITVTRQGAAFDEKAYVQATVRVWFGLVNQSVVISL